MHRKLGLLLGLLLLVGVGFSLLAPYAARNWDARRLTARIDAERVAILSIRLKVEAYISLYEEVPTRGQLLDAFFPEGLPEGFAYVKGESADRYLTARRGVVTGGLDAVIVNAIVARNPVRDLTESFAVERSGPFLSGIAAGGQAEPPIPFLIYSKRILRGSYFVATRYLGPLFLKDLPPPMRKRIVALRRGAEREAEGVPPSARPGEGWASIPHDEED